VGKQWNTVAKQKPCGETLSQSTVF
jgi:hypothetical protein